MIPSAAGPRPTAGPRPRPAALRVLRALVGRGRPSTLSDLHGVLGGHPNGVRLHLDRLVSDGFVELTSHAPSGRGRPPKVYRATLRGRQVAGEDGGRHDFHALLEAVAEEYATRPDAADAALRLGRTWGHRRGGEPGAPADLVSLLAAQGYTPEADGDRIRLLTCPLLASAHRHPEVVCTLHQGLIDAVTRTPATLVPFAEPGACVVHLPGSDAGVGRPPQ